MISIAIGVAGFAAETRARGPDDGAEVTVSLAGSNHVVVQTRNARPSEIIAALARRLQVSVVGNVPPQGSRTISGTISGSLGRVLYRVLTDMNYLLISRPDMTHRLVLQGRKARPQKRVANLQVKSPRAQLDSYVKLLGHVVSLRQQSRRLSRHDPSRAFELHQLADQLYGQAQTLKPDYCSLVRAADCSGQNRLGLSL